jgi:CBS-domain-containing membrane protein
MTTEVVSCGPQDTLAHAAQLMWDRDIGCVAVADESRRVIGMITDRDICMAALIQARTLDAIDVDSAMAHQVVLCTAREDVACVERRMAAAQVRRIPVVDDDGCLLGVLAVADLARGFVGHTTSAGAVAVLVAAIAEPRTPHIGVTDAPWRPHGGAEVVREAGHWPSPSSSERIARL